MRFRGHGGPTSTIRTACIHQFWSGQPHPLVNQLDPKIVDALVISNLQRRLKRLMINCKIICQHRYVDILILDIHGGYYIYTCMCMYIYIYIYIKFPIIVEQHFVVMALGKLQRCNAGICKDRVWQRKPHQNVFALQNRIVSLHGLTPQTL